MVPPVRSIPIAAIFFLGGEDFGTVVWQLAIERYTNFPRLRNRDGRNWPNFINQSAA
jgi:hypothetical protein